MADGDCLEAVESIIREVCGISGLHPDQDFYDAGVTSVQALPLLMELEDRFEVAIPDDRFITVRNTRALCAIITEIKTGGSAA
jgi:acyl carrier protein